MEQPKTIVNRWRNTRGYGVQSPADYRFLTTIIKQKYPFYAYSELSKQFKNKNKRQQKLMELLLRIANYRQPATAIIFADDYRQAAEYIKQGCKKTNIFHIDNDKQPTGKTNAKSKYQLITANATSKQTAKINDITALAADNAILFITNINANKKTRELWNSIRKNQKANTTFDMKHSGIALFGPKQHQKHYLLNY